jgi:C1A family cysteine protease
MWIYKTAKKHDVWKGEAYSGTSISGACLGLLREGACLEEFWPYVQTEQTTWRPGAVEDAMSRKIKSYFYISYNRTNEIKQMLLEESLWFSIKTHKELYYVGKDGIVDTHKYLESEYVGGHAMAIIGWKYIDGKLHWEVQNSWGSNWGDDGYCFIPDELIRQVQTSKVYYLVLNEETHQRMMKKHTSWISKLKRLGKKFDRMVDKVLEFFKILFKKH